MVLSDLINKKDTVNGYDESAFTESYWLDDFASNDGARINRSPDQIVKYFSDLFKKLTLKGSVLDIGAGAGNIVNGLRLAGISAYGCEFSSSGRALAKKHFNIDLDYCDLRASLSYPDDAFDYSFCLGVLSMIPMQYLHHAIAEIFRVTKYAVLVNVGTFSVPKPAGNLGNPHHITFLSPYRYFKLFSKYKDITSLQPPQKMTYGIGVVNEFAGLFAKIDL